MSRQKVLETFLNDEVDQVEFGIYKWRGILYEILPYKKILKSKKLKASHFIKFQDNTLYGIREISPAVYKKHYLTKAHD